MRKFFRDFLNFLKGIFIAIVNPSSILSFLKIENFDKNYNKVLANERALRWIAFVIAVVAVITVRYEPTAIARHSIEFPAQLQIRMDQETYEVIGHIPETVTVYLMGDPTQVNLLRNSGNLNFYIDLHNLEPNEPHNVLIEHDPLPNVHSSIRIEVVPGVIGNLMLEPLVDKLLPITNISLREFPELEPWLEHEYQLEIEAVHIRGRQSVIDNIFEVRALLIYDANNPATPENGTITKTASLIAEDIDGNVLDVVFLPRSQVQVELKVVDTSKTIRLVPIIQNIPSNVRLSSVTVNPVEIDIWGLVELIGSELQVEVSYHDLNNNGRKIVDLVLPDGVFSETTRLDLNAEFSVIPAERIEQ